MYKLILSQSECQAIAWIGYRYFHGDQLTAILWGKCKQVPDDIDWDEKGDITFLIPEYIAWEIREGIEDENRELACFSGELKTKLLAFIDSIV